jgi:alkanesulfonate monooxygenase SsuD/methylene tetrahydromethanopterin reductase-like flavin-dependent oxidoreductase (luciferase family)
MEFAVNVPTSVGGSASSQYSMLPMADEISWEIQRDFGVEIEALGFDGLAVPDHVMTSESGTMECTTVLAALAAATETVYIYPKTINNPLRHGPFLAKTLATVDVISDGRLKAGMGAGWKEDEAVAYGYDWPDAPTRLRELEETIDLMTRLWTEDEVDYDGDFYTLSGASCRPHPVQDPHPPIMVGGGGEQFTLRIAAKYADCWNYWGSTDVIQRKLDVLRDHCETYGTDYDAIQKSWFARCAIRETDDEVADLLEEAPRFKDENVSEDENHLVGTPEEIVADVERYAEMGVEEVVVEFVDFPGTEGAEVFANEVIPAFE